MSQTERHKDLCLQMVAAWNRWDVNGVVEHWAPDVVHYSEDREVSSPNMVELMKDGLRAFPDLQLDVKSILAEGDKVILRITVTGTHKAEFAGVEPTGRNASWHLVEELRFREGKVIEHWDVINYMPMLKAIGKVPSEL